MGRQDTVVGQSLEHLIRHARQRKGLTQKEAAKRLGISAQYFNDLELGRRHPTDGALLRQLANVLHLSLDILMVAAGRIPDDVRAAGLAHQDVLLQAFALIRSSRQRHTSA